jgi:hypothetical protein
MEVNVYALTSKQGPAALAFSAAGRASYACRTITSAALFFTSVTVPSVVVEVAAREEVVAL